MRRVKNSRPIIAPVEDQISREELLRMHRKNPPIHLQTPSGEPPPSVFVFDNSHIRVKLPIHAHVSARRIESINLNVYNSLHPMQRANQKKSFDLLVAPRLYKLPKLGPVSILYVLFPGSKVKVDTANIASIVDKYFCDSLTKAGVIPDDVYYEVIQTSHVYGAVAKGDPHMMAIIDPDPERIDYADCIDSGAGARCPRTLCPTSVY